ncbi:DUF6923 family protein [Amycolatopsis echigonensis]|uniref:Serine protease n=1 Tax=Amycolatopsis echigonensis TaxID=2576905 RepID=A0A8E1VXV6_9PSEU|nr:serine protease [Amycolatopsis echigonensis]MBB2500179.1 serine protease [Amycolatopsis echigonensis]
MRGSRYLTVVAAAAVVAGLLVASGWLAPARQRAAAMSCQVLQVESRDGWSSDIVRLTLPAGARHLLHHSPFALNAIAYSAAQDVTYGVADGRFHDGWHAVRIDSDGELTDLGPVGRDTHHGVWSWVTGATAGAMSGNSWYVKRGTILYTVDVDPRGSGYLTATGPVLLRPWWLASEIDDFAYNPEDGLLYGVSSAADGAVVTVNPVSGQVAKVPGERFPDATYGSVVFGPDHKLYATANWIDGRSVTYRMDGGSAVEVSTGPPLVTSDGAGCLAEPPPPPPPPPPTPSSPSPTPTPAPSSTPTTSASPTPSSSPPAPTPPSSSLAPTQPNPITPTPPPRPPDAIIQPIPMPQPPAPSRAVPLKAARQPPGKHATKTHDNVKKQRRWGLATVLLIVGGGAVAARARRAR